MALFSPYRYKVEKFQGYDITKLGNSFRSLEILENRDGEPNINVGLNFIGPCGTFRELPRTNQMTSTIEEQAVNFINAKSKFIKNTQNEWVLRT